VVAVSASTLLLVTTTGYRCATWPHPVSRALALLAALSDICVSVAIVITTVAAVIPLRTLTALSEVIRAGRIRC
jgi:hypothetical protein